MELHIVGDKKSLLPRTRDDSSDEEENLSNRSPAKGALLVYTCMYIIIILLLCYAYALEGSLLMVSCILRTTIFLLTQ